MYVCWSLGSWENYTGKGDIRARSNGNNQHRWNRGVYQEMLLRQRERNVAYSRYVLSRKGVIRAYIYIYLHYSILKVKFLNVKIKVVRKKVYTVSKLKFAQRNDA